jgi:hypothetical protein
MDLDFRAQKLEKEAEQRRKAAARKRESELKKIKEQEEREEQLRQQREEQLKLLAQLEEERLEKERLDMIKTAGIKLRVENLIPYDIEGEDDKIILPESCLSQLTSQDAFTLGACLFELIDQNGNVITHCGVREFNADENSIGIPPKIKNTLASKTNRTINTLTIRYVRLPKITSIKLRLYNNQLFQTASVKSILEENLRSHSTLTLNDMIDVWYRGKCYTLQVSDIKPESYGTLIDTDVEVEFELSPSELSSTTTRCNDTTVTKESTPQSNDSTNYKIQSKSLSSIPMDMDIDDSVTIPPEPEQDDNNVIHIRFRTPQGMTLNRKFLNSQPIQDLFHYISSSLKIHYAKLQLSTRAPDRIITLPHLEKVLYDQSLSDENSGHNCKTLEDFGFKKREMLVVSLIS